MAIGTPIGGVPNDVGTLNTQRLLIDGIDAGAVTEVSEGGPSAPAQGQLWFKSDTGRLYVNYEDADSQQWVEVGPAPGNVSPIVVGQRFLCEVPTGELPDDWSIAPETDDAVPLIRNAEGNFAGGSWDNSTGLTATIVAGTLPGLTVGGVINHNVPPGYTGTGGALDSPSGDDGEVFTHNFNLTISAGQGNHVHAANVTSSQAWRPAYREMVILEYDGPST